MISVVILTRNEEVDLPGCLASVVWSDDVVVFDSFSTDRTVEIAGEAGARVFQRRFDNYAAQRNAALEEVDYRHPWIVMVDADERWDRALFEEMSVAIRNGDPEVCLYYLRRKDFFRGVWLRRSTGYPTWFGRLMKPGMVRVEREINEEYCTSGRVGYLQGHFIHYPFSKGIDFWFERHNRYSSMEAARLVQETKGRLRVAALLSKDPVVRRKWLKQLAYRLPGRPFLVFLYLYLFRLGALDGLTGLGYCTLRTIYEYMIDLKVKELKQRQKGLPL
ncbi:MAG: glycosyltransferase family 2 protein [Syntrophobacteraceae bacterium]